jgi:hypothetical protein
MGRDVWIESEPCPCGEGAITRMVEENDWMKREYYPKVIECPKCKEEYEWKSTKQIDRKTGQTYTKLVLKSTKSSEE